MSAHKNIDRICSVITVFALLIGLVFCNGKLLGIETSAQAIGYENRLFNRSEVHKIDIILDDWDGFLETCESEQYTACHLVIDGEAVKNVGIRGKGNTSLSSVKSMNSNRYSFKIEFDQYENGKTYHGLDKLCLNNLIQDNTYMKDYIAYTMMLDFGVNAPLCSYVDVSVNGEEWGLYLAVESVEDSFLKRNYGTQYGNLYKPDSMSFGGGRGNGMEFDMNDFMGEDAQNPDSVPQGNFGGGMPNFGGGGMPNVPNGEMTGSFSPGEMPDGGGMPDFNGGSFGMGSDDVKLKYTDDAFDSYSNIFNNAKTDINTADKKRLISSLKALYEQTDIASTVDVEEVLRYFVVHNFLVNGDSYTGMMIHNYYLYEKDGQLSMIPWDYNLGFGSFQGGSASSSVNSPIDSPVSSGDMSDRPMVSWIFATAAYTEQYHQLFSEFINRVDFTSYISETAEMIDSYVQNDATKFCTYEEFQKGVAAMKQFCELRTESVNGQLSGTIPSTSEAQKADSSTLVDASGINISDMGTMNMGGGGFGEMNFTGGQMPSAGFDPNTMPQGNFDPNTRPDGFEPGAMPDGFTSDAMPGTIPDMDVAGETQAGQSSGNMGQFNMAEPPQMGNFNPMGGQPTTDTKPVLLLFAVSIVALLGGLVFAFKFKR